MLIANTPGANIPNEICLQCFRKPMSKGRTFCSNRCATEAENDAPKLISIPKDHIFYEEGLEQCLLRFLNLSGLAD